MVWAKKKPKWRRELRSTGRLVIYNLDRDVPKDKVTPKPLSSRKYSRQRNQQVQRPWGRNRTGWCGWSTWAKERGKTDQPREKLRNGRGREVEVHRVKDLVSHYQDFGFSSEVEESHWRHLSQRMTWPDSRFNRDTLAAVSRWALKCRGKKTSLEAAAISRRLVDITWDFLQVNREEAQDLSPQVLQCSASRRSRDTNKAQLRKEQPKK